MKTTDLTLWEKIKMEYYIIKFWFTDKQPPELTKLLIKKHNLKNKRY